MGAKERKFAEIIQAAKMYPKSEMVRELQMMLISNRNSRWRDKSHFSKNQQQKVLFHMRRPHLHWGYEQHTFILFSYTK
jgi:uncharacterized protein YbaP (TraB family)